MTDLTPMTQEERELWLVEHPIPPIPQMPQTSAPPLNPPNPEPILFLDPALIRIDPEVRSLREWGTKGHRAEMTIPELALSIARDGQDTPAIVREDAEGYVLVDGMRRWEAVSLLRHGEDKAERDTMLECLVRSMTPDQAFHAALRSFVLKEPLTGLELAHAIKRLRAKYRWAREEGSESIADLLCINVATVTQTEKLLKAPVEVQDKVRRGLWSVTTALELMAGKAEKLEEVAAKADELALREAGHKCGKKLKPHPNDEANQLTCCAKHGNALGYDDGGFCLGKFDPTVPKIARKPPEPKEAMPPATGDNRLIQSGVTAGGTDKDEPNPLSKVSKVGQPVPPVTTKSKHVRKAQELIDGAREKPAAPKSVEIAELFEELTASGSYQPELVGMFNMLAWWIRGQAGGRRTAVVAAIDDVADKLAGTKTVRAKGGKNK